MKQPHTTMRPRDNADDSDNFGDGDDLRFTLSSPLQYPPPMHPSSTKSSLPPYAAPYSRDDAVTVEPSSVHVVSFSRSDRASNEMQACSEFESNLTNGASSLINKSSNQLKSGDSEELHNSNRTLYMESDRMKSDVNDTVESYITQTRESGSPPQDALNIEESVYSLENTKAYPCNGKYHSNTIVSISETVGVPVEMILKANPYLSDYDPYNDVLSIGTSLEIPDMEEAAYPQENLQSDECNDKLFYVPQSVDNVSPTDCLLSTDSLYVSTSDSHTSFEISQSPQHQESIFEVSIATEVLVEDILALNPHLKFYPIDKPLPLMTRIQLPKHKRVVSDEEVEHEVAPRGSSRVSTASKASPDNDKDSNIKPVELFCREPPMETLPPLSQTNKKSPGNNCNELVEEDSKSDVAPSQNYMNQNYNNNNSTNSLNLQNGGCAINLESFYSPVDEYQIQRNHVNEGASDDITYDKLEAGRKREGSGDSATQEEHCTLQYDRTNIKTNGITVSVTTVSNGCTIHKPILEESRASNVYSSSADMTRLYRDHGGNEVKDVARNVIPVSERKVTSNIIIHKGLQGEVHSPEAYQPTRTLLASGSDTLQDICNEHCLTEQQLRAMNPFLKKYLIHTLIPVNTLLVLGNSDRQVYSTIPPSSSLGRETVVNSTTTTTTLPLSKTKVESLDRSTTIDTSADLHPPALYKVDKTGGIPIWECQGKRVLIVRSPTPSHGVVGSPQLSAAAALDANIVTDIRNRRSGSRGASQPQVGSYTHGDGLVQQSNSTYQINNGNNIVSEQDHGHVNSQVALLGPFDELPKYTVLEIDEPFLHKSQASNGHNNSARHGNSTLSQLYMPISPSSPPHPRDCQLFTPSNSQSAQQQQSYSPGLGMEPGLVNMNLKYGSSNSNSLSKRQVVRFIEQRATMLIRQRFFSKWRLFISLRNRRGIEWESVQNSIMKQTSRKRADLLNQSDIRRVSDLRNTLGSRPHIPPSKQFSQFSNKLKTSGVGSTSLSPFDLYHGDGSHQKLFHRAISTSPRRNTANDFSGIQLLSPKEKYGRDRSAGVRTGGLRSPIKIPTAPPAAYRSKVSYKDIDDVSSILPSSPVRSPLREQAMSANVHSVSYHRLSPNHRPLERTRSPLLNNKHGAGGVLREYIETIAIPPQLSESTDHKRTVGVTLRGLKVSRVSDIAADAGIHINDLVLRVDGILVCSGSIFQSMIDRSKGPNVSLTLQTPTGSRFTVSLPIIFVPDPSQGREPRTTTITKVSPVAINPRVSPYVTRRAVSPNGSLSQCGM